MPNILADVLDDLLGPGSRDRSRSRGYNEPDWDWGDVAAFDDLESGSPEQETVQYQTESNNHASANASDFTVNSNATAASAAAGNRDSFLARILNTSEDRHSSPQTPGRQSSPRLHQPANPSNEAPRSDDFTTLHSTPARTPPLSEARSGLHALRPSSSPSMPKTGSSKKRKSSDAAGASRPAKHAKHGAGETTKSKHTTKAPSDPEIEKIDLANDDKIEDVLKKQREEQVKAQAPPAENPTKLSNVTCVICMDTPKDLTATSCGHVFCHTCLMEALIAGENRAGPGELRRSQCPVCRKTLNRSKAGDIIPLLIKQKISASQPRKRRVSVVEA